MKRHVYLPSRTVTVEDGVVRDLDGNTLGWVGRDTSFQGDPWNYSPPVDAGGAYGPYRTQRAALTGLLADQRTPIGGPNLFDRPA